jgi:putative heme-binding domain-containing protein
MRCAIVCTVCLAGAFLSGLSYSQNPPDPYGDNIARTAPRTPADERKAFHLPPGFDVQLVASEPEIHKPINIAFDDHGRLWLSESVEYPFPAKPGTKGRDAVKVLEDFAEDGHARKVSTFADDLNIPIGVLPLPTGALVYSIPSIWRLTDTDGGGKADKREMLLEKYGYRDTHGMTGEFTLGFDGWVYACHGYSNTSTVKAADGSAVTMQSGNTYRFKVDGSHVEQFTHGQVNPFGLSFDPLGNLYSCDCHTRPIYQLLRGAFYDSFGKPHDGLGYGPEIMSHDHGSTAIAGITYYAADHFPKEYQDTVFVGNVVTNRINHDRLEKHGSSYRAIELKDFLSSDDPWFRPVDIKLGPDGALYVADFYNRIIGHYEVPLDHPGRDRERGRIWRIIYRGPDGKGTPVAPRSDWTKATVSELIEDLAHPNLTVRLKATNQLVSRCATVNERIHALLQARGNPWQRMHGLWVLERRGALDDATLAAATRDPESGVRVHAQRILAERATLPPTLREVVLAGLLDRDAYVQRCAADALGRHPSADQVRPLLDLLHTVPPDDTHLRHVVRMALRDHLLTSVSWSQLPTATWSEADARAVADVAPGVPSREAAQFLFNHVQHFTEDRDTLARYVHHIARHGNDDLDRKLLELARGAKPTDLDQQVALLQALEQGWQERGVKLSDPAKTWALDVTRKLLTTGNPAQVQAGIERAGSLKLEPLSESLVSIAGQHQAPEQQRSAALNALMGIDGVKHAPLVAKVLADESEPAGLRDQAAALLARTNQSAAQDELVKLLPTATARLQNAIALGLSTTPAGAEKLLAAVAAGKASARLLQEKPVELRLLAAKIPDIKARLAKLTEGLPPVDEKLQKLFGQRRAGFIAAKSNVSLGEKVFEKHCANCHQLGGKGAKVGPQLDGVGIRGVDRLLEDILDPNRNVDQAFRATTLELKNGTVQTGLLLREEGEVLVMADAQGKEVRVPKGTVAERTVSQLSPMPGNLVDQIPEPDFYDLLAYLLKQQPPR